MERSVNFTTREVQATLDGRKTMFRKVIKINFEKVYKVACFKGKWNEVYGKSLPEHLIEWYVKEKVKPPYQVGDVIWVRETWCGIEGYYLYKADNDDWSSVLTDADTLKWRSPVTMPREAARLILTVKSRRVERLQSISEEDAWNEGARIAKSIEWDKLIPGLRTMCRDILFVNMWNSTNLKRGHGWDKNNWVWVTEFEKG